MNFDLRKCWAKVTRGCVAAVVVASLSDASGATLTNDVAWPTSPAVSTSPATPGSAERDMKNGRINRQSFTLDAPLEVATIYLGAQDFRTAGADVTAGFYTIADPNSTDTAVWDAGTLVGSSFLIDASTGTDFGDGTDASTHNLRIDLDTPVSLAAGTYYLQLAAENVPTYSFKWDVVGASTITDVYAGGRIWNEFSGADPIGGDWSMALAGAVPEPTSLLMLSLGGLAWSGKRRR